MHCLSWNERANELGDGSPPGTISYVICGLATVHAVGFVVLWRWSKRDYRSQYRLLEDFTSGLSHRSRLAVGGHIADQVDAFLADIRDVLGRDPTDSSLLRRFRLSSRVRWWFASRTAVFWFGDRVASGPRRRSHRASGFAFAVPLRLERAIGASWSSN